MISICISLMISAKIFLCTYWPFVYLPWRNGYSSLPIFHGVFSVVSHIPPTITESEL